MLWWNIRWLTNTVVSTFWPQPIILFYFPYIYISFTCYTQITQVALASVLHKTSETTNGNDGSTTSLPHPLKVNPNFSEISSHKSRDTRDPPAMSRNYILNEFQAIPINPSDVMDFTANPTAFSDLLSYQSRDIRVPRPMSRNTFWANFSQFPPFPTHTTGKWECYEFPPPPPPG